MSFPESQREFYEGLQYEISKDKIVENEFIKVSDNYRSFLRGKDKELVIFKTDFVEGRIPLSVHRYAFGTLYEVEYDELKNTLDRVFEKNRVKGDGNNFDGQEHVMRKIPDSLTENLQEFCVRYPGEDLDIEKHFKLLRGEGNPLHGLIIERYIDPKQRLSVYPLAEIWTLKLLGEPKTMALVPRTQPVAIPANLTRLR